jgi:hypothetical protein
MPVEGGFFTEFPAQQLCELIESYCSLSLVSVKEVSLNIERVLCLDHKRFFTVLVESR